MYVSIIYFMLCIWQIELWETDWTNRGAEDDYTHDLEISKSKGFTIFFLANENEYHNIYATWR